MLQPGAEWSVSDGGVPSNRCRPGKGFRAVQARPRCCREEEPWLTKGSSAIAAFAATQSRLAAVERMSLG
jgi:hypothetical protein